MLNSKFMITLVAMCVMIMALFGGEIKQGYIENFAHLSELCPTAPVFSSWGGAGVQTMPVGSTAISRGGKPICTANTKLGFQTSECGNETEFQRGVSTVRNIQPLISPRGNGAVAATPLIRYRKPKVGVMAYNPTEPHQASISDLSKMMGPPPVPKAEKTIKENYEEYEKAQVPLPKDMCNVNLLGSETQPVIYDRLMYSNMRSSLRGKGDYIRGDLQITPDNYKAGYGSHNNWFQVSVKPERDLNPGCMEHLFGRKEELAVSVGQGDLCVPTFGL